MKYKINIYILLQVVKSCALVLFIFITIAWLLQITRLLSLTNLIQIDIFNVIYLSIFLIPNLLTVILPFIVIFGLVLCFVKLNRDKEITAIFSLGMEIYPIRNALFLFSILLIILYLFLNFYISPKIYGQFKLKEFELRNTINFEKMTTSNFLKLDKNTTIDFQNKNNSFEDIFISFKDTKENIIFAKNGIIKNENNKFIFQLNNGFKININQNDEIEKLEFKNYILRIDTKKNLKFTKDDKNSLTIFEDIRNNDYENISYKFFDIIFSILIIYLFYKNNILRVNLNLSNNFQFILISIALLLFNQILKNSDTFYITYIFSCLIIIISSYFLLYVKNRYVQS